MKVLCLLVILSFPLVFSAQNLDAFTDARGWFTVWDNGTLHPISLQKVQDYSVGKHTVSWINTNDESWVYYNGENTKINEYKVDFHPTDNTLFYSVSTNLLTFDGAPKVITPSFKDFKYGDELVAYQDIFDDKFRVYSNNEIQILEELPIVDYSVGENNIAYLSYDGYFTYFIDGEKTQIFNPPTMPRHSLGRNMLAYIDEGAETFQGFVDGDIVTIDDFMPKSFQCGDGFVVYTTIQDQFMIYENGESEEISAYSPESFYVVDNMIVYTLQDKFYVYLGGQSIELENFIPANFQIEENIIAYLDQRGVLIVYSTNGKEQITSEKVTSYRLTGNTINYQFGQNDQHIYHAQP